MLERFDILHEEALEDLIRQSYEMVAAKLPRTAHRSKPAKPSKRKRRTGKAHR
jgi:hypothetical protein